MLNISSTRNLIKHIIITTRFLGWMILELVA